MIDVFDIETACDIVQSNSIIPHLENFEVLARADLFPVAQSKLMYINWNPTDLQTVPLEWNWHKISPIWMRSNGPSVDFYTKFMRLMDLDRITLG